jgi:hypothetical protein
MVEKVLIEVVELIKIVPIAKATAATFTSLTAIDQLTVAVRLVVPLIVIQTLIEKLPVK